MKYRYTLGTIDETGLGHPCVASICWLLTPHPHALIVWGEVYDTLHGLVIASGQCIEELVSHFRSDPVAQNLAEIARRWSHNHLRRGSLIQEDHLRTCQIPSHQIDIDSWAKAKLKLAGLDPCPHTGHVYGNGRIHEQLQASVAHYMSAFPTEGNSNA